MRTILITGASGGLAQALIPFLKDDFLILLGRDREKLAALYAYHPHKILSDVSICDAAALAAFLEDIKRSHGPIDILINNAGYARYDDFDQFSAQEVEEMFAVNLFALMTLCRLVGKEMKARRSGHIINIISMSAFIASAKSSVYSATKFAALGFSNSIRLEVAPYGVSVTTVNPGPVATPFFDLADPDGSYQKKVSAFLLSADDVAAKIARALETKPREVNLPFSLVLTAKFYSLFPGLSDYLARRFFQLK